MSVRRTHLAFLAAAILPLVAACGNDKRPVTPTIRGSSSTHSLTVTDSSQPTETVTETTAATVPASYVEAEAAYTARKYADAADLFGSYTRANPENPWGHYMHGLSAWKAGDQEQAMTSFDEALRIDPQHRKSLLNSARVLLETSRPQEALERTGHYAAAGKAYESALAADSTYGKASASLARITPLAATDTTSVDLSALVSEFRAEVERWQDVSVVE